MPRTIGLRLLPGARGTKRLVAEYGDRLVCVRYRYDAERGKRIKTIELIVDEIDWSPARRFQENAIVSLRIEFNENMLRDKAKSSGGRWDPNKQVWLVRYGAIAGTDLEKRIIDKKT